MSDTQVDLKRFEDLGLQKGRYRHELKYEVAIADAERFFQDISPYCDYDSHAGQTKSYEIASVYYDTADLRFYFDREESVGYRRKIRLRSYNTDGKSTALFIEIKEKHKQFVSKKRINLKSGEILERGIPHCQLPLDVVAEELEDSAEAREIVYLHKRLNLFPVVNIRYHRKALIPHNEPTMRITLDTFITAGKGDLPAYNKDEEQPIIQPHHGVLEVKTNQSIPLWLHSALTRYGWVQTRYSKYCLGVDKIYGKAGKQFLRAMQIGKKPEAKAGSEESFPRKAVGA